jgi:drug/metabolite transporter (DMT)-like permease
MLKILTLLAFFSAQFLIAWYGAYSGKLSAQGTLFGMTYDSVFIRAVITQIQFFWLLIIINVLFSMGFHWGFLSFKQFLIIAILWIGLGALANALFGLLFAKETIDLPLIIGFLLVIAGSIVTVAHADIAKLLR